MTIQTDLTDISASPAEGLCARCRSAILSASSVERPSKQQELAWVAGVSLAFAGMMLVVFAG